KRRNPGRSTGQRWTEGRTSHETERHPDIGCEAHRWRACMIDADSVRAVEAAQWTRHFIKPLYDSYCFSQIPRLVRSVLGNARDTDAPTHLLGRLWAPYDRVILFCV